MIQNQDKIHDLLSQIRTSQQMGNKDEAKRLSKKLLVLQDANIRPAYRTVEPK